MKFVHLLFVGVILVVACRPLQALEVPADPEMMIQTVMLPDPDGQQAPYPVWVRPDIGLMIEFPRAIKALHGRGFRIIRGETDGGETSAEWVAIAHRIPKNVSSVEEIPGPYTLFMTPLLEQTNRVLHITLGDGKLYSFLFCTPVKPPEGKKTESGEKKPQPPPVQYAQARLRFTPFIKADGPSEDSGRGRPSSPHKKMSGSSPEADAGGPAAETASAKVVRTELPPESAYKELDPEAETGLLDFLRLLQSLPRARAIATAAGNEVYQSVELEPEKNTYVSTDTHKIIVQWAVRDTTSSAIALAACVENLTDDKLILDVATWAMRVSRSLYKVTAAQPAPLEVLPHDKTYVQLVVARDDTGAPLDLAVTNSFIPTVGILSRTSARPFTSFDVTIPE